MPKLSKRNIVVLFLVLLVLLVAFHIFFRFSPAYSTAVAAYSAQHGVEPNRIGLCLLCRKNLSYGNGSSHYTFTLIVDNDSSSQKVIAHSQSVPGTDRYAVTFE